MYILEGVPNKGTVGLAACRKEIQARRGGDAVLSWGKGQNLLINDKEIY